MLDFIHSGKNIPVSSEGSCSAYLWNKCIGYQQLSLIDLFYAFVFYVVTAQEFVGRGG